MRTNVQNLLRPRLKTGRASFYHMLLTRMNHKTRSDLRVDNQTPPLDGRSFEVPLQRERMQGGKFGLCLQSMCQLCVLYSKPALEDLFTRTTSSRREIVVLTTNIIKTFFPLCQEKNDSTSFEKDQFTCHFACYLGSCFQTRKS